jgi:hypothetical protein
VNHLTSTLQCCCGPPTATADQVRQPAIHTASMHSGKDMPIPSMATKHPSCTISGSIHEHL